MRSGRYLILGATGTLGSAMCKKLLQDEKTSLVRCLSRDELKLSELERSFADPRIETVIGDIREFESIYDAFDGIKTVFHFAALKRIPEMDRQPFECLKTNLEGTHNAALAALNNDVEHFVFSSTDKACQPINTYGASKFLSEQMLFYMQKRNRTNFSIYRWANVISSRGAVVYAFKDAIENGRPAFLTDERMTRFWIKIEDAVDFVLKTYETRSDTVKVPSFKAAKVTRLLDAIGRVMNKPVSYEVIGMRAAEKLHESMTYDRLTNETYNSETAEQYTDEELDDLVHYILNK